MNMVARATDSQCFHTMHPGDSAHVCPKSWLNAVTDEWTPVFCGKDAMDE